MRLLLIASVCAGCTCVSVTERSAPERPEWLDHENVGHADHEPTRHDAVQIARMKAALPLVEASFGVLLGSTYEEVSQFGPQGDRVELSEAIRVEARGLVRWTPGQTYSERVADSCQETDTWRAWATVNLDARELRQGLTHWLATRGRAQADVIRRGHGLIITAARQPAWAYVVAADSNGRERLVVGARLEPGAPVNTGPIANAVQARVFLSPGSIPGRGPAQLRRLYTCLQAAPKDRCTLIHRDLR